MAVYLLLAISPIVIGAFWGDINQNRKSKIGYLFFCGCVMLFIMGFRHYSLGSTDTMHYYNSMKTAINSPSWESYYQPNLYEVGTQLLTYILSRFFSDPQWLLIVTSLIYIVSILYFSYNNCDNIPIALSAYISLGLMQFHLQGLRQSIAMCICLFAYEQAKRKKTIRFILLVFLATTFHQTAIVFVPVYFLCRMRFSYKNIVLLACGAGALLFSAERIIGFANNIFSRAYSEVSDSTGGLVATAIYAIILIISFIYFNHNRDDDRKSLFYILIIGMACYLIRYVGALEAERISFYFSFSQLALLPLAIRLVISRDKGIMCILLLSLTVALFAYRLNGSDFVPYMFCWQ